MVLGYFKFYALHYLYWQEAEMQIIEIDMFILKGKAGSSATYFMLQTNFKQ